MRCTFVFKVVYVNQLVFLEIRNIISRAKICLHLEFAVTFPCTKLFSHQSECHQTIQNAKLFTTALCATSVVSMSEMSTTLLESRPNQILVFITNPYKILLPEFECSVCFSVVPEVHPRNKCNCQCVVKAFFLVPYFCKIFQTSRPNQIFMLVANFSTI